jgi:DNA-binding transcriptional ArsR family regulator
MAEQGLQQALAGLFPRSRWRGTTLEMDVAVNREFHAAGRGVTLMPSMMGMTRPLIGNHPDGSVLVVYPGMTPLPLIGDPGDGDPLAALLGTTRAAALRALMQPRSTTGLASQLGVSAASASEHARTLRAAGLIATRRTGKAVWHSCTPLGVRLVAERAGQRERDQQVLSSTSGPGKGPHAGP